MPTPCPRSCWLRQHRVRMVNDYANRCPYCCRLRQHRVRVVNDYDDTVSAWSMTTPTSCQCSSDYFIVNNYTDMVLVWSTTTRTHNFGKYQITFFTFLVSFLLFSKKNHFLCVSVVVDNTDTMTAERLTTMTQCQRSRWLRGHMFFANIFEKTKILQSRKRPTTGILPKLDVS